MSKELTTTVNPEIIQKLVLDGDLSKMNPQQKVEYYNRFCQSLGLNHLTQPFQIIKFQGKEKLYATKDCTEQLRKIHGVSITDVSTTSLNGVFIVTAKAQDKWGKTDAATGAVTIENLKGDNLANALMKAETKAKRRVTLSICGLGMLDESELETMPLHTTHAVDTPNVTEDVPVEYENIPTKEEKDLLKKLVWTSSLPHEKRLDAIDAIEDCKDYKKYMQIQHRLEAVQPAIDEIINPSQTDIKNHLKQLA